MRFVRNVFHSDTTWTLTSRLTRKRNLTSVRYVRNVLKPNLIWPFTWGFTPKRSHISVRFVRKPLYNGVTWCFIRTYITQISVNTCNIVRHFALFWRFLFFFSFLFVCGVFVSFHCNLLTWTFCIWLCVLYTVVVWHFSEKKVKGRALWYYEYWKSHWIFCDTVKRRKSHWQIYFPLLFKDTEITLKQSFLLFPGIFSVTLDFEFVWFSMS